MADDSIVPQVLIDLPDGMIDCTPIAADIDAFKEVYISDDHEVTTLATSADEATVRKRLGYATRPFKTGYDNVVPIQSRWRKLKQFIAGASVVAGEYVKFEYGSGAINGQVITWTPGTDDEDQIVGQVWLGGGDTDTVEVFTI